MKRLTIGLELVTLPSVLFLDEVRVRVQTKADSFRTLSSSPTLGIPQPTTGLDSRSALTVARVIRKIASTGRTCICTIHQPSAELFFMFDRLLL